MCPKTTLLELECDGLSRENEMIIDYVCWKEICDFQGMIS